MIETIIFGFFFALLIGTFSLIALMVAIDMDNEKKNRKKDKK